MDNCMILGFKHVTGVYKETPYDFVRLYIGREVDKEGGGWENYVDDYHNKIKTLDIPNVLPVSSLKQLGELLNRPCHVYFNRYGGIDKIELI